MNINDKNWDILTQAKVGFEFEMFPKDKDIDSVKRNLSSILDKKILVFDKSHSDFSVTRDTFKIEPDYSGGKKTLEFITGALPYTESRLLLTKVLRYISENGTTNDRVGIHLNVSFDEKIIGKNFLTHMDVLKFILDFDENKIFDLFPKRKNNVYAKSIKFIIPQSKFYTEEFGDKKNIQPKNFIVPNTKYYGINFTKLIKGYLEFRYIGGKDYEKKETEIVELLDYLIVSLYTSITNKEYTDSNFEELKRIFSKHRRSMDAYKSIKDFKTHYPDIQLTVDMKEDEAVVSTFFNNIRDSLFSILTEAGMLAGKINYDSDKGTLQLKDTELKLCYLLKNVELYNCKVMGTVSRCDLHECDVQGSDVEECNIYRYSKIKDSKLKSCYVSNTSSIINSYIFGKNTLFAGKTEGGIFREGKVTKEAEIAKNTEVIEFKKI